MKEHALHKKGQLTSMVHFTDSGSNFSSNPPGASAAAAIPILTSIEYQDTVLTRTHWGINNTRSIRIHGDVVSPKLQG